MKKVFLSLLFAALSFVTFAQQWNSISGNCPAAPQVKLVTSDDNQVVVDFSLSGFNLSKVSTPTGIQQIVSVPKMVSMLEAGAPDLPQFAISAIIGDAAEMEVSVTESAYIDYEGIEIAPSKGNLSRQIDPETVPYAYGEMYARDAFYPATPAGLEAPYIMRDFRGQNIMVMPFAYNPVSKTLRVYTNLTLTMTKVSDNGENPKAARKSNTIKVDPQIMSYYDRRFVNFGESTAKYNFIEDFGEMIVICPEQYMEAMQPFVDWKNQSGRPTTMVSLADAGGNSDTQIKNYLQNIYQDPERNLTYILLVGDYSDITPHSMSGGRSDNWFGQLEGSDYYVEAFTGRFSVQSVQDVNTHVNKVLYYERDMQNDVTWVNTAIGIGANEGSGSGHNGGEADYVHMNYIRDTLLHYTYNTVTQQYSGVGSGTSAAAISADFNNGASWCNYCNHGSQTSWGVANYSNSDVNALVNDYMWPYIISVACNNGQFDGTCFGETWLRATNNSTGVPTGAIGGMFSWISQPWQPPMTGQDEMVDIITEWIQSGDNSQYNHTMGGAFLNGNMKILDAHPSDNGATHNTWLLFGDPSLMVRTDNPTELTLTCNPSQLLVGMSELNLSMDAEYAIATLSLDGEILASSRIIDGNGTLSFDALTNVGEATLTILAYNKVTYNETIQIIPAEGAFLTIDQYSPKNVHVGEESILNMTVKNVGEDPTSGTTDITISCDNPDLTIINGTATIDLLNGNATIDVNDVFSYSIAEGVADGTKFTINVTMTCGSDTWEGKAVVTAGEAILEYNNFSWQGSFEPGETITVIASFKNIGHYKATNAIAAIATSSEYISIENETIELGTIDIDGIVYAAFHITIDAECPTTEQLPINFTMTADGGLTAEGSGVLKNSCNVIFNLTDSWGDGWNGANLLVSFSDGSLEQNLTISSGNSATYTLEIGSGVHVTLTWRGGSYDAECSFSVAYEDGTIIYQTNGTPQAGVLYEFDCNCAGGATGGNMAPVEDLEAVVDGMNVVLTWTAPEGAIGYRVTRNGIDLETVSETTYNDELQYWNSTYCVIALYEDGESAPECIIVQGEDSIEETEVQFHIYPNPTKGMLNINGSNDGYSYVMYNGMGQVVANGTAQGTHQINVSDLTKGVYFIRLTSGMQTSIQKLVVD